MTSIMHPAAYASQLATKAQQSLADASTALHGFTFMPDPVTHTPDIGIPERNGPDSPDNPWFVRPEPRPDGPFSRAAEHARAAIRHIDDATRMGSNSGMVSRDVLAAFGRARTQAQAGVTQLTSQTLRPIDPRGVALEFDGASLWLGLAKDLLALDMGTSPKPPVTIQPVDAPEGPHATAQPAR